MITLHNGKETIELLVNDDSYSYEAIMGEDTLTLYFSHPGFIHIPVGAWCEFYGKRYSLKKDSNFKKNGERNYEYTLVLETSKADTQLWKVRNVVDNRIKFSYTAKPREHLELLVKNLNRRSSGWVMGECIEGTEKVINYNHTYILDGLSQLAETYETEWQITETVVNGVHTKTIHLRKVEYNKDTPLALSYGKGHGFKVGVGRESGEIPPEIILVETTDRNINYSKYGAKELLLPKTQTLRFDGECFEGEEGFDASKARTYKTDEYGTVVMRADREPVTAKEDSLDCTEIYPSREGTISEVIVVDKEKSFYDFIDKDIPDALDFSQYRIDGETATIVFQTGMLAGKEFELEQTDKALTGYVHSRRRFKIVPQEIDGITMPGGDVWVPKVGDKYAVFGIQLPEAYICDNATKTGASWDVFRQAAKYLYEHEDKEFTFTGTLDGIWAKKRWLEVGGKIVLGGFVNFSDTQFHPAGSLIRMTGIKRYVNNPYSPEIELSNASVGTSITSDLNKIETNEVVVDDKHKEALQFTKRRFRDARETMDMLAASLLNYSGSVNPITVATMQMLVGDESLQFRFVSSKTNPVAVSHNISYNASAKVLHAPAGILQHMTLGIKELSSTYAGKYQFWDMAEYHSPSLVEPEKKFYLYAKCSRTDQSGTFLLSETAIGMEQVEGYYHFLVGILNSENDGDRSYASLYGFTEVLPGRITTDKIVSTDGNTYFDVKGGEIGGRIKFVSTNGELKDVVDTDKLANNANVAAGNAQSKANDAFDRAGYALTAAGSAERNAKDHIAQSIGYTNYTALENAARAGETIIEGGKINTMLINAKTIVTSKLIADAIGTNTLNVANKFIVYKDGTTLLCGPTRTPFTSGTFSWDSDGPISVSTLGLQNNNNIIITGNNTGWTTAFVVPFTMDYNGFEATIVNDDFNGERSVGIISASAPPGYYFYENGEPMNSLEIKSKQGVKMIGITDGSRFKGWLITQRFETTASRGHFSGMIKGALINCLNNNFNIVYEYGDLKKGLKVEAYNGDILVTHNLGHSRYFVVGNANGGYSRSVSFKSITANSFIIHIFDTGGHNELWTPVSFVMIGDNR